MNPRAEERLQKRMPCMIEIQGEQQKAIVLNLSRAGFYVQTMIAAQRGQSVSVLLDSEYADPLDLRTQVVWKRRPASRMYELGGRGLGLRLSSAPPCYLDLCDELLPVVKPAPGAASAAEEPVRGQPYRVRLRLEGSSRSSCFEVDSVSEASAAAAALVRAAETMPGRTWEVLDVSLVLPVKSA